MDWQAKVALVTGASSGIGCATARLLARQGLNVAVTARREGRLYDLVREITRSGGTALAFPGDLRDPAIREHIIFQVREAWGPIDVLVNNAGFGWAEPLAAMSWETASAMLDIHVYAVVHLTHLVLPEMLAARQGWIINMASIAGDIPAPPLSLYCATKSMIQAFSEGLYREVRREGVHVGVINPGPVATEFGVIAYGWQESKALHHGASVDRVATAVWRMMVHRKKNIYIPWYLRFVRPFNVLCARLVDWGHPLFLKTIGREMHR
ncbi:MAG: SDR family NAD(P)-dependent oxidoreductase [Anaerolineae bacterium]|nr:SDR family NAD(P)-dependent oxidoreductase [Anaerolineae bacterium]